MTPHPMQADSSRTAARSRFRPKQRISHTKSRNGCYTCKQRRVKCDEERPTCSACRVRGDDCVFPNPGGTRDLHQRRPPFHLETPSSEQADLGPGEDTREVSLRPLTFHVASIGTPHNDSDRSKSSLNMNDLNLLQHYILHTSKKMTLNQAKTVVWECVISEMASANEFLMHLVLALAGLDILNTQNRRNQHILGSSGTFAPRSASQIQLIVEHHQQGLAGLQEELCATTEPDAEALLAGSMLVVGFAFASLGVKDLDPSIGILQESSNVGISPLHLHPDLETPQVQWLRLVRGVTSITEQFWWVLRKSRLRSLLFHNNSNEDWKAFKKDLCTNITANGDIRSKRLQGFAAGASCAVSGLRDLFADISSARSSEEGCDDPPSTATPNSCQSPNGPIASLLDAHNRAIDVVENIYMRILYVLQMKRLDPQPSSDLEIQADLEDAALSSWPHLLPEEFISSLDSHRNSNSLYGVTLTILAHLYLTIAILEDIWYFGKTCDIEVHKINTLVVGLGDERLAQLMKWPMEVIRR
ncbi:C6 finger domain protein [Penicillium canariense]|uniref:C6 finger domain protein n=1 Tax=Penicillium canariense TaxID=189055 RepID=A0A9W9I1U9_9EURO|nr:C6 finger domain protein [Penicillium canariense]KAJ5160510.1 C6 finger domain protein [Penicillium canariense]